MGFSKITSVEVTNFMVYSRAKLVFDESNIVNIKGYNSAGKSTMLKAIGVCLTNMFPKAQTKLIRHGEEYFRVVVNFSDGVSILRDKYANGQSLYEMYKDGVCIFTTKEGKKLSKVDDVPEPIKAYLGLCETSYGYLNYQSRQDKLWLVETTGSENYATLNEILKSEEISRANALINSDRNRLSAEITEIEAALQAVRHERISAEAYTPELLEALEERERYVQELNRRAKAISRLSETVTEMSSIVIMPVVSIVDAGRLYDMLRVVTISEEMASIKIPPTVSKVDGGRLSAVSALRTMQGQVAADRSKILGTEIASISLERATAIGNVCESAKVYIKDALSYSRLLDESKAVKTQLDTAVEEAKQRGIHFVKCDSCGSYTEVSEEVS